MDTATMLERAMRYVDSYRDVLQQNPDDWKLEKVEEFIADVRDEMLRREYAPAAANELDTLRAENARLVAEVARLVNIIEEIEGHLDFYCDVDNYSNHRGLVVPDAAENASDALYWLETLREEGKLPKRDESEETE